MSIKARILRFVKSIKFRFFLVMVFLTIVPGTVISVGVLNSYEDRAVSLRESEVRIVAKALANQIAASEYDLNDMVSDQSLQAQFDMLVNIYGGRVMVIDRDLVIIYDSYNLDVDRTIISKEVVTCFDGTEYSHHDSEFHYIELSIPLIDPSDAGEEVQGVLLVSVSTDNIEINRSYLRQVASFWVILVGIAGVCLGLLFVGLTLRPLQKLCREVAAMKDSHDFQKLDVYNYSETAEISDTINAMVGRMQAMDESRQEFVSNVSHELKTPMTSIKVLADTINSMPNAPLEMYQEFMGDITSEIDRENQIITDLLSLVKMDKSSQDLNITNTNINELLSSIMRRLQPIADRQKVDLVLESFRPIMASVDEVKLSLAFTNLIENAIKYNSDDGNGWVHVSLNADHQYFYVKVEDNGMGIPEADQAHIYERFYRVNKSHSREIGGTGLGLAITRGSINVHHGTIRVYSVVGEGTTFDVRIPLNYIAPQ